MEGPKLLSSLMRMVIRLIMRFPVELVYEKVQERSPTFQTNSRKNN